MEIISNETFTGGTIYPDEKRVKTPDSELYKKTVRQETKVFTHWVNKMTGGSETVSGTIDISPETLDHLIDSFGGGAFKTIERSYRTGKDLVNSKDVMYRDMPVVRKFYIEPNPYTVLYKIYDMYEESGRTIYSDEQVALWKKYLNVAREDGVITNKQYLFYKQEFKQNQKEGKRSLK